MKNKSLIGAGILMIVACGAAGAVTPLLAGLDDTESVVQEAAPSAVVEFYVYLPLRNVQQLDELLTQLHDSKSPRFHQWLQPADFLARFGPSADDLASVSASVRALGFTVVNSNAHGVRVRGSASAVASTFSVAIQSRTRNGLTRYMASSELQLPSQLAALHARIIGLEGIPERRVNLRITGPVKDVSDNRYGPVGPYWFDDLKQAYDYPAFGKQTDGSGVRVAVLMSDLIYPGDVTAVFNHEKFTKITGRPVPWVNTVLVDGGGQQNGPGSVEASLDVQQVLGGAPGSRVTLVSIPDLSDKSIFDGYAYIVDTNAWDIVNSSFGGCELEYTAQYNGGVDHTSVLKAYHELFAQGNAQGITFVASSGDQGGLLCPSVDYGTKGAHPSFVPGVSTPADDPDVTAVGGGNLVTRSVPGSLDSGYVRESAFADPNVPYDIYGLGQEVSGGFWGAGGGISTVFRKPAFQILANTGSGAWRTLPDVGMHVGGCPQALASSCGADDSSVVVAFGVGAGGGYFGAIGTSVSSPEFVGALALFEQQLGKRHRLGNANYFLYAMGAVQTAAGGKSAPAPLQYFHRNIRGFDGYWGASHPSYDYNYIYGNGSPDVRKLFNLSAYPTAGVPQTPGNP